MSRFLRTIRFDGTDPRVFERAAEPGEWAVSGAFAFADLDPAAVTGKLKQAFANGFLGLVTFGRSTLATVGEATPGDLEAIEQCLIRHFIAEFGAPDEAAARPAAQHEMDFVLDLVSGVPVNTIFTVRRTFDANGRIREELRTIRAPVGGTQHARIWKIEPDAPTGGTSDAT